MKKSTVFGLLCIGLVVSCSPVICGDELPGGSYERTCKNCDFDGKRFVCECNNRKGKSISISAEVDKGDTCANIDGTLICGGQDFWKELWKNLGDTFKDALDADLQLW